MEDNIQAEFSREEQIRRLTYVYGVCFAKLPDIPTMTIEPHGEGEALYIGRDHKHHGLNIVRLVEPAHQWPEVREWLLALPMALVDALELVDLERRGHAAAVVNYRKLKDKVDSAVQSAYKTQEVLEAVMREAAYPLNPAISLAQWIRDIRTVSRVTSSQVHRLLRHYDSIEACPHCSICPAHKTITEESAPENGKETT